MILKYDLVIILFALKPSGTAFRTEIQDGMGGVWSMSSSKRL